MNVNAFPPWLHLLLLLLLVAAALEAAAAAAAFVSPDEAACSRRRRFLSSSMHQDLRYRRRRIQQVRCNKDTRLWSAAKRGGGGGGGGFGGGSSKNQKNKKPSFGFASTTRPAARPVAISQKTIRRKLEREYGGTSPQAIAAATQTKIERAMAELPPHLQRATQLYQQLRRWEARWDTLSVLDRANVADSELEGARRARDELHRLREEHGDTVSEAQLHNLFQRVTWDASADAKAARAVVAGSTMPPDIGARIDRACQIAVDAVLLAAGDDNDDDDDNSNSSNQQRRCLDVGCGFGTLVPNLLSLTAGGSSSSQQPATLKASQIYGVDLSPAMIRNANELYPECNFEACDFLHYSGPGGVHDDDDDDDGRFDAILFCSALHDLPDPAAALRRAARSLLRRRGRLVIVHAQGAAHVSRQAAANPVLVRRGLPDAAELQRMVRDWSSEKDSDDDAFEFVLETEPAKASTARDMDEGYLAVIQRVK